jgi:UDP-N-acetylmuramoyl-L-alanyl-D-glutamate--2,6-diaminopimelate ligase
MAAVAEKNADVIVVTSDNPRTEDPDAIIADVVAGLSNPNAETVFIEPDRAKAIKLAIDQTQPNDIVLIAGKGHEDSQVIGTEKHHFSDFEEAQKALEA